MEVPNEEVRRRKRGRGVRGVLNSQPSEAEGGRGQACRNKNIRTQTRHLLNLNLQIWILFFYEAVAIF